MKDIFISFEREDEATVAVLRDALERADLDVWWDRGIPSKDQSRQDILTQLESAKCVIVVWSEASTGPNAGFVIDEATRAKARGTLLAVRIADVAPPPGFGEQPTLDLIAWTGNVADPRCQDVVTNAKALIEGIPNPKLPAWRHRKEIAWGAIIGLAPLALGAFVDLTALPKIVCGIPSVQMFCGEWGLGGAPSRAEKALWSSRPPGDCSVLRTYLSSFPNGAYSGEAHTRLAAITFETKETWTPEERRLPMVVRPGLKPFPDEQAARADALARSSEEAHRACVGFAQAEFRLLSAGTAPLEWRCTKRAEGHACGFDGEAVCKVEARRVDRLDRCP